MALGELALVAVNEETLEKVGDQVEKVTKRFSFVRYVIAPLFFIGWGLYFLLIA